MVRAGDKVGFGGRKGAGEASLLKVLSGEAPPAGGTVLRRGALGYLLQEARPSGAGVEATALSHVLSGRGIDEQAQRLEKLRVGLEEDPSARHGPRRPTPTPVATAPSPRSAASPTVSGWRPIGSTCLSTSSPVASAAA